jgi:hypothetical protein
MRVYVTVTHERAQDNGGGVKTARLEGAFAIEIVAEAQSLHEKLARR